MKQLSRFEANLLHIVHGIMQRAPLEKVLPLATTRLPRPECLSRPAVELLQDTLTKGAVSLLAHECWRRERFLRNGRPATGRLWQRTPPHELGLAFSRHALSFLIWLTAWERQDKHILASPPADQLTVADRFLFFLTYRLFRNTAVGTALGKCELISANGLCRLMFPDDFAVLKTPAAQWTLWTGGLGSCILESLQASLAKRWIDMETGKGRITGAAQMLAVGQSQEGTLQGFFQAVGSAGRRDLARFVVVALGVLLADSPTAQRWIGGLQTEGIRLGERVAAQRAALAFLRQTQHLQQWNEAARGVGYFDEDYAASQMWKADWEAHQGDEQCQRAQVILREIEPL